MNTPMRLGNIYNDTHFGGSFGGTVWSKDGVSPTLETAQGGNRQPLIVASRGRLNTDNEWVQQLETQTDMTNTLTSAYKDNLVLQGGESAMAEDKQVYRIRKLTPKECFRLMGVKDEDYAKLTVSDTQKYKQAGNSIVVDVLQGIFENMFVNECKRNRLF